MGHKKALLKNKNDLIEGTFCYLLFEDGVFNTTALEDLISDAKSYLKKNKTDLEVKSLLIWIIECVKQCFISQHDKDDLFLIKNYSKQLEHSWNNIWEPEIQKLIGL